MTRASRATRGRSAVLRAPSAKAVRTSSASAARAAGRSQRAPPRHGSAGGSDSSRSRSSAAAAACCWASFFERPSPRPASSPRRRTSIVKCLSVVGSDRGDHFIARQRPATPLRQLLELGLRVNDSGTGEQAGIGFEITLDRPSCRVEATVQVDRPEQRLERISEERRLSPPPERSSPTPRRSQAPRPIASAYCARERARDRLRFPARQLSLGFAGKGAEEPVGGDQAEHGVAQELEPLVVSRPPRPRWRGNDG